MGDIHDMPSARRLPATGLAAFHGGRVALRRRGGAARCRMSHPARAGRLRAARVFALMALLAAGAPLAARDAPAALLARLAAPTVVAISDGDFTGQTYADGRLAPADAGHRDLLTVLGLVDGRLVTGHLPVSNSVTSAPEVLALAPGARTAFVTERLGERPRDAETVSDLPPGNRLFAVDISNPARPRLADTARVAQFPEALAVHPEGHLVAVVSNTPESSFVQLVPYARGSFGPVKRIELAGPGVRDDGAGPRGGVTASNVQWHPSGRFLAVNIHTQDQVAFFELTGGAGNPGLRPWGNRVTTGTDPFVGRFTPDGRFYLTADWGRNLAAPDLAGRLPDRPSSISVIRLADPSRRGEARHARIASVETDVASEGLAVSPDGRLVATVNMRGTAFPPGSGRFQREGSVTLLALDPAAGRLEKLGDYPFEGVLPEGGSFDLAGEHFLATVFQGHRDGDARRGAGLEVFQVRKGARPALERLGRIPLPHGVHHVAIGGGR